MPPEVEAGLFDLPPGAEVPLDRARQLVAARIMAGQHPLSYGGRRLPLHPDAPRSVDRSAPGPRCGTCKWRVLHHHHDKSYPKCEFGDGIRVSHGESSDVRAWWPACHDYAMPESTNRE